MKKVWLVGAGPGAPDLITVKGKRVLEQAECVVYDHLASAELLTLAPAAAERIYVGKKKADHTMSQEDICALLVGRGLRGLNVVRLKGGDPFLFGRGGEEAEALAGAGIPFEVVPGVASPLGIGAYTGVPLTHRDHTSVVTFVTGHDVDKIDWTKIGTAETLVVFMGLSQLDSIASRVIAAGRDPQTPAMAVRWGTRPDQQVIAGTLENLPHQVKEAGMKPPATIVIGDVVAMRDRLSWFEKLPLHGRRVVITRAHEQAGSMRVSLEALGAEVIELPTIRIQPAADFKPLDAALARLPEFDWLIFTSVNGVRYFLERLAASPVDVRAIRGRICAIGPATREAIEQLHLKVDVTAGDYVAEGVLKALEGYAVSGAKVLIARAAVARDTIPMELTSRGARVEVVEAYRTVAPEGLAARAQQAFATRPDWAVFTSSSTAANLITAIGREALDGVKVASIGPVTSAALRARGVEPTTEARAYTIPGVIDAIARAEIIES